VGSGEVSHWELNLLPRELLATVKHLTLRLAPQNLGTVLLPRPTPTPARKWPDRSGRSNLILLKKRGLLPCQRYERCGCICFRHLELR
jgi:hypothetical protein